MPWRPQRRRGASEPRLCGRGWLRAVRAGPEQLGALCSCKRLAQALGASPVASAACREGRHAPGQPPRHEVGRLAACGAAARRALPLQGLHCSRRLRRKSSWPSDASPRSPGSLGKNRSSSATGSTVTRPSSSSTCSPATQNSASTASRPTGSPSPRTVSSSLSPTPTSYPATSTSSATTPVAPTRRKSAISSLVGAKLRPN